MKKISVVTPSYNQGHFLEETILSVIGQGYPNLEYIVIDGGSSDNSVDIIKKYESHLAYWESEKDMGQSHAINKGFAKATGDIFCWLNSDDMFMPSALSHIGTSHAFSQIPTLIFGNCIHFKEMDQGLWTMGSNVVNYSEKFPLECFDYIIQPSSFWSRAIWEKVGPLSQQMNFAFDWEWFLRAKKAKVNFQAVNKCLSMYRLHGAHKSSNGKKPRQDEIFRIYQQYSPHYAILFNHLMDEDLKFDSMSDKILRRTLKLLRKSTSTGNLLKHSKAKKYRAYSIQEVDNVISML